jgi:hypothetical protein
MQYESPEPIPPVEAEDVFRNGRPEEVSRALIAAALSGKDRQWVEQWVVRLSRHQDVGVRSTSAVSLGHIARLHGEVSQEALEAVSVLRGDERAAGAAENALEDIEIFRRP